VYTLDSSDKAVLGCRPNSRRDAKVTGTLNGDTIQVASVAASK